MVESNMNLDGESERPDSGWQTVRGYLRRLELSKMQS